MQTYSHYIITAAINRVLKQDGKQGHELYVGKTLLPPVRSTSMLIGSVAPDLPLIALSIGFMIVDRIQGNPMGFESSPMKSWTGWLFDYAFFNVWWVKALHNFLHAPFILLALILLGHVGWASQRKWGAGLFWFALSCLLHTLIDITCHVKDGPLFLFPFDWQTRFHSPVSYWDPAYHGREFSIFEHILILGLIVYLFVGWLRARRMRQQVKTV